MRAWGLSLALVAVALGVQGAALAQDVMARITQLNKRAMDDYDKLEFEDAKRSLLEAVALIKKHQLENDAGAAKTYVNLGVVYVGGLKDRYKGFQLFVKALALRPDAKIDPAIA